MKRNFDCVYYLIFNVFINDNLKMNNNHYSDSELLLMPYQDLRRLSILLQLPANIKKKYMISMIQAHQKGDECLKAAIANKVMEERKVKRLINKKKQSKLCMGSTVNTQKAPTDLSVSSQHEFETRFSYVAHFSKDEISSGISRIIKEETEVSQRNRSVLQQSRKPTRKLSTVGKTEIMLPRNHSLTTPVRLMPQYERGFPCPGDYEFMSGLSNAKNHFQDLNYNYHFHGEFSNALVQTTSNELHRNEPYWHAREVYNNSLMPILSSLLTPSSVTINSSSYASQYSSENLTKGPTSFQGVYENYVKSNSVIESQTFQSSVTNSSALILSNHNLINENNNCSGSSSNFNLSRGSYLNGKATADFQLPSAPRDINCQHCYKKEATVVKNSQENHNFLVDFYATRNEGESALSSEMRDLLQYGDEERYRPESKELTSHRPFDSTSMIAYRTEEIVKADEDHDALPQVIEDNSNYVEEGKLWEESQNGLRKILEKNRMEKEGFVNGFEMAQTQGSFESVSETSINFSTEADSTEELPRTNNTEILSCAPNPSRCRYSLGHDKYPEAIGDSNKNETLPPFPFAFCTSESYNKAYSVCKNSTTGTTETHLNPIMTCTYASQFPSQTNSQEAHVNSKGSASHYQRQWCYSYPEYQVPLSVDSTTYNNWNEFSNGLDSKIIPQNNNQNVQVVKCRTHGWHYLYSTPNPCD